MGAQGPQGSIGPAGTSITLQTPDGGTLATTNNGDGTLSYNISGGSFFDGKRYSATTSTYADDGTLLNETRDRNDGSQFTQLFVAGQTVDLTGHNVVQANNQGSTTFVFNPGYEQAVALVQGFTVNGDYHDTLNLPSSDFGSVADVLHNAHNVQGGVMIADPTSGDAIRLAGVTKAQLVHNQQDFAFFG